MTLHEDLGVETVLTLMQQERPVRTKTTSNASWDGSSSWISLRLKSRTWRGSSGVLWRTVFYIQSFDQKRVFQNTKMKEQGERKGTFICQSVNVWGHR